MFLLGIEIRIPELQGRSANYKVSNQPPVFCSIHSPPHPGCCCSVLLVLLWSGSLSPAGRPGVGCPGMRLSGWQSPVPPPDAGWWSPFPPGGHAEPWRKENNHYWKHRLVSDPINTVWLYSNYSRGPPELDNIWFVKAPFRKQLPFFHQLIDPIQPLFSHFQSTCTHSSNGCTLLLSPPGVHVNGWQSSRAG